MSNKLNTLSDEWALADMSRRGFLATSLRTATALSVMTVSWSVWATPATQQAAIFALTQGEVVTPGKVKLVIPRLAENGNSVSMQVAVESPMEPDKYVKSVHIFSAANPIPTVASYYFTPSNGRAEVNTRIRLNDTQTITAIAQMSDGSLWSATAKILVTIAACTNPWL